MKKKNNLGLDKTMRMERKKVLETCASASVQSVVLAAASNPPNAEGQRVS